MNHLAYATASNRCRLILFFFISVISGAAFAEDFTHTNNGVTLKYASTGETTCKLVGYEGQPDSVEIPSRVNSSTKFYSVTEIGQNAFQSCSSLTSVTIPESVTSIGNSAFYRCSSLKKFIVADGEAEINFGSSALFYAPIDELYIGRNWKYDNKNEAISTGILSVTLGEKVTLLPDYAFYKCNKLTSVTIPASVTSIGSDAFNNCTSLDLVHISSLESWCKIDFANSSANPLFKGKLYLNGKLVEDLVIPDGITEIRANAFFGCSSLASVTIPSSVTSIGEYAFYGCSSLASVTIPSSVTSIGRYAFYGCFSLPSVTIPSSVTSIGGYAFYDCSSLTSVTIPESVTKIGEYAFRDCSSLDVVHISSLESWCKIDFVSLNANPLWNGGKLYLSGELVEDLVIADGITEIRAYAFAGCSSLASVIIPESVTTIGGGVFSGCSSLTSVVLPGSLTEIGEGSFAYCNKINQIIYDTDSPVAGNKNYFPDAIYSSAILYMPQKTIEAAKNIMPWGLFESIKPTSDLEIPASISLSDEIINVGEPKQLIINVVPKEAKIASASWSSSNPEVASIDGEGTVTGIKAGTSTISVTIDGGMTASCKVTVFVKETGVALNVDKVDLLKGESIQLEATVSPEEGTDKTVSWSSSNGSVATVDNSGKVTALGEGTSTITATTINGYTASCVVTVTRLSSSGNGYTLYYDLAGESICRLADYSGMLKNLEIPSEVSGYSVVGIGDKAFYESSSLTSVTIPASVTSIGNSAFYRCSSLKKFIVADGDSEINFGSNALVYAPIDELYIGRNWTYDNEKEAISTVILSVTLGEKVTTLPDYAFNNCNKLASVTCNAVTPPSANENSFSNYDATLYVPYGSIDQYKAANPWSRFQKLDDTKIEYTYKGNTLLYEKIYDKSCKVIGYSGDPTTLEIPSEANGYSVIEIGGSAFSGCSSLTSVTIPESVTTIGSAAFFHSSLTSVTIPASVTKIEYKTFQSCSSLTSVTIPASVTSIGEYAFYNCSSLTSVTIPASVTSIGWEAFYNCSSLKKFIVADGDAEINFESGALVNAPIYELYIGRNWKYDNKKGAISTGILSVTLGEKVTTLPDYAFNNCNRLVSVTCNAVTPPTANDNSFSNYSATLYVPSGSIDKYKAVNPWRKFQNISDAADSQFEYTYKGNTLSYEIISDDSCKVIGYSGEPTTLEIPSEANGYSVVGIGDKAFSGCTSLTSVTIPESVTSIGRTAFYGCSSLTSVTIPESVTSIGGYAFYNCSSLTSVTIPESVTKIGEDAFRNCSSLASVTIPSSVTSIGTGVFQNCSSLTSVTIPESVTSIGNYAFNGCSSLTSVTIPESVTSIGNYAFNGCSSLTSVTIPESVTSIGEEAFRSCSSLDSVHISSLGSWCKIYFGNFTANPLFNKGKLYLSGKLVEDLVIPDGITQIRARAFNGCSSLASVTIPASVTSIGEGVFNGCSSLTSVTIPESVTSIGNYAFNGCSSLTSVTIPESVTSIGNYAFNGCSSLTSVTIPASVTSIGREAFYNCSSLKKFIVADGDAEINFGSYALVYAPIDELYIGRNWKYDSEKEAISTGILSVTLGEKVTTLPDYAFNKCNKLASVTCYAVTPPSANDDSFSNYSATLYVPSGSIDKYKAANPWSKFTIKATTSGIEDVKGNGERLVRVEGGEIVIDGEGTAEVFNISGVRVAASSSGRVSGLPRGIYIVRFNGNAYKVKL